MMRTLVLLAALSTFALPTAAQQRPASTATGRVVDASDGSALPGATVVLRSLADTTAMDAAITDSLGAFALRGARAGAYRLRVSYVGFETFVREVRLDGARTALGAVALQPAVMDLDEVTVEVAQERFRLRGDTVVLNADAYRVNPDASAEELVTKMPGVVLQDGQVQAQGEAVQRVTVDGREFFGSDPMAALRNLPADVVQSVEIYDRESDQAQFTGFRDGDTEKTINIVTRTGMRSGRFGKVHGGYGEDTRYASGGNVNVFSGDRRVSLIGMSNNVNQQNFAFEDLLGLSGEGGGRRGPGGRGGMRGGRGGRGGEGFNPRDFLVGQQGGLNTTTSLGLNYSDRIGRRLEVSGSYFFNRMANANDAFLDRALFLPGEGTQHYSETTQSTSTNLNHRLNARIEYTIDEHNSVIVRPSLSFQDNTASSLQNGANVLSTGALLSEALSRYASDNTGYTSSTDVLFRHRFPKAGRTLSANLALGLNDRWGDADQRSVTAFYEAGAAAEDSTYEQEVDNASAGRSVALDIDLTEPVGERGQLRLSYEPSYGRNVSDRAAYVLDLQTGHYTILDPTYSSLFDNDVVRHQGGVTYAWEIEDRLELQVGVEVQNERLLGDQTYPVAFALDRSFFSILPEAELELEFGEALDLDLEYETSTNTPSVGQLQDVVDNTNPLFLTSGNPELEPSYAHSVSLRGRRGDWQAGRMFFAFATVSYQRNAIGTASLLAVRDTVVARGVTLQQGSQFSYPVNLDDPSLAARSFFGLGTPFPLLKSNLNVRGGATFARTPGLVNGVVNTSTQYALSGGLTVASNVSERLDFTLSYGADYTIASNSFYARLDEDYVRHDAGLRLTWMPLGGLVVESSLTYNDYLGLDEALYPTTFVMNAGLGYKFLRQDAAELKLVVGDLFNQETGISRSITELYVQDSRTQVLGRYVLLNLSYRFRNFGT